MGRIVAMAGAAAAVLVVGVVVGVLRPFEEKRELPMAAAPRGVDAPSITLVLGSGERVDLGSREGVIAGGEGGARISNEGKRLTYEAGGEADTAARWNRLIVPRGGEYRLELADGTRIWLNAESELEYPEVFGGERGVRLKGEAYFEVAKDSARRFVVETEGCVVEVLGTRFNVSAYPDEPARATLAEGSVRVGMGDDVRLLRPNEQAVAVEGGIEVREVDASQYISWVKGEYVFRNTPLREVAAQLGRWYDVEFRFVSDSLREKRMAGMIPRSESLEFSLDVIGRVAGARFEREGDTIFISGKEQKN